MSDLPSGVLAPCLTPFEDDMSIATSMFIAHAERLMEEGCAGLAPFGTTGEALSVGIDERIDALRALVEAGLPADRMIPGTGLTSLADTVRLSRACLDLGCAAVMTLPPFFYRGVGEEGLYAYFESLAAALPDGARVCLYHIPRLTAVDMPISLVARLHREFPETFVAIKDSSGDWENTAKLLGIEGLKVYPGTEMALPDAVPMGAAGCITASANVNARAISRHLSSLRSGESDDALTERVRHVRRTLEAGNFIAGQKRMLALMTGDARWANVRPPLMRADEAHGAKLRDAIQDQLEQPQPA